MSDNKSLVITLEEETGSFYLTIEITEIVKKRGTVKINDILFKFGNNNSFRCPSGNR
jgi:hypothetical protein